MDWKLLAIAAMLCLACSVSGSLLIVIFLDRSRQIKREIRGEIDSSRTISVAEFRAWAERSMASKRDIFRMSRRIASIDRRFQRIETVIVRAGLPVPEIIPENNSDEERTDEPID